MDNRQWTMVHGPLSMVIYDFTPLPIMQTKLYNTGMASWIVHLRIAEKLQGIFPELDPARFAVGNITPDSGIPDEKWEHFTPPAEILHFQDASSTERRLADLEFYRRYLVPLRGSEDGGLSSFRVGYFCHLITDNLWAREIGRPTLKRYAAEFAADKDFIWEVKKDWYGLDFLYVRDHPDCLFWRVFLAAQPETGGLDFLLPEGARRNVEHIQEYYQRSDAEIQAMCERPYIYLSMPQVDHFVDESTQQIARILKHLWIDGSPADEFTSALDLSI
jgi:hypothetical protein